MEKQKKFKKQELKHEDFEVMEQGAKAVKVYLVLPLLLELLLRTKRI